MIKVALTFTKLTRTLKVTNQRLPYFEFRRDTMFCQRIIKTLPLYPDLSAHYYVLTIDIYLVHF